MRRQNGYKGAKLTFGGGKNWEYKSSRGRKKPTRKKNQKVATFFCFYFEDSKMFVLYVGAPFEFSGRAPFKLFTPLDIISIQLSAIIGSKSLSVYLDNLVQITDKIKPKFFRLKHRNLRFNLDKYTVPHEK